MLQTVLNVNMRITLTGSWNIKRFRLACGEEEDMDQSYITTTVGPLVQETLVGKPRNGKHATRTGAAFPVTFPSLAAGLQNHDTPPEPI
jgi:hypothetical protein